MDENLNKIDFGKLYLLNKSKRQSEGELLCGQ